MKKTTLLTLLGLALLTPASAEEKKTTELHKAQISQKHHQGSEELADDQDTISADVQELIDEQTNDKVIKLLSLVETLMAETIDQLEEKNTGGDTIAIQTQIIEKIYEAAQEKNKSPSSGSPSSGAMLQMMKEMMGKGDKPSNKPGDKPGDTPGQGQTGDSNAANDPRPSGPNQGKKTERRIPKAAGKSGNALPTEFQKALDAYNKTAPKK